MSFSSIIRTGLSGLSLLVLVSTGCVAPISVKEGTSEAPRAVINPAETLATVSETTSTPLASVATTLDALRRTAEAVGSGDEAAIPEYNFLTARLIDHLIAANVKPWQQSLTLPTGDTRYLVRGSQPSDLSEKNRNFIPSDRLTFSGRYARQTVTRTGIGAPLVAFTSIDRDQKRNLAYRALTAVVSFSNNVATVDLHDPFRKTEVILNGRRLPLRADYGSNIAYALSKERIDELGFARLINPARYDDTARLSAIQPYDPDRIPVLLVHGLQDTPASFAPMYFELMEDPRIRQNFQFWVFSYPSGYPYPMPAALLRKELDRMRQIHPEHKDIVIIGHSMGGLISRLMVTDVGNGIWESMFGAPPSASPLKGQSRDLLESALVFNARSDIDRAIFISAPHRGSELATNIIGWIGVKLVRFPATLASIRDSVVTTLSLDRSGFMLDRFPSSIDTLSPKNGFVRNINQYPIKSSIPFHSIMGDRGRGDTPDSSDGIVAYWSSHLDGAASERIVPSNHSAHQNPEGIEEVRRILHLHADLPYTPAELEATPGEDNSKARLRLWRRAP